jgi:hypothetical protein
MGGREGEWAGAANSAEFPNKYPSDAFYNFPMLPCTIAG